MPSLQTIQNFNLQHTDVLEKLKMQVRDMKVNLNVSRHDTAAASVANSNHMQLFLNPSENRTPNTSTDASEFRHHRTRHSLCRLSCPEALHATTCPRTCRPTDCPHPLHLPARPRTRMPTRHRHETTPDLRRKTATGALRNSSNKSARWVLLGPLMMKHAGVHCTWSREWCRRLSNSSDDSIKAFVLKYSCEDTHPNWPWSWNPEINPGYQRYIPRCRNIHIVTWFGPMPAFRSA